MSPLVDASWAYASPGADNSGWIAVASCFPSSTLDAQEERKLRPKEALQKSENRVCCGYNAF